MLLAQNEKVLIVFRRLFESDIRQHFVGAVEFVTPIAARVRGYTFLYDVDSGKFVRKANEAVRVIPLGESSVLISVLPNSVEPKRIVYKSDAQHQLVITDNLEFSQSMVEFSGRYNSIR